jgi:cell shape-determining protein MreC
MTETPSHKRQVVGSLIAAILLVVVTVALVTAKIGPGLDSTELREREERQEERLEQREERLQERQED